MVGLPWIKKVSNKLGLKQVTIHKNQVPKVTTLEAAKVKLAQQLFQQFDSLWNRPRLEVIWFYNSFKVPTFLKYPPWSRMCPLRAGTFLNLRWQRLHSTGLGSDLTNDGVEDGEDTFGEDAEVATLLGPTTLAEVVQELVWKTKICLTQASLTTVV